MKPKTSKKNQETDAGIRHTKKGLHSKNSTVKSTGGSRQGNAGMDDSDDDAHR